MADEAFAMDLKEKGFDGQSSSHSETDVALHLYNTDVPLEDYLYYAQVQRAKELAQQRDSVSEKMSNFIGSSNEQVEQFQVVPRAISQREEMLLDGRRALRQAGWAAVFYLITTDILGPFNAPFAFSQVGFAPGVLLYFFMGVMAFYGGLLLWKLFLQLDSDRYPIKTYADLAERIFGRTARTVCTLLQSVQLIVNVGTICLSNGQALSQISKGKLCFAVCIVIWAFVGMVVGQIRTLKNYGWLANSAVWINLLIIFISMGFVAHSPPNFVAAEAAYGISEGPVETAAFVSLPLAAKVNGIMNMVFAYGGAMIFPEMMAEMRRPMDFWKGMAMAQMLIFAAYMLYGVFIYSFQGQFTLPLAYQGVSKYSWQTVGNVLSLITGLIAAGLYGNIGIKVAYINIVEDWLRGPPLLSKKGHIVWMFMVLLYWALAFVIGSAIPQVQTISGLIAAVAIMQFTYSFPPLLLFGYQVQVDAMKGDNPHVVGQPPVNRADGWGSLSRWKRGLFSGRVVFKMLNFLLFLASLSLACLGMFGSGTSIKDVFEVAQATSFGCQPPV